VDVAGGDLRQDLALLLLGPVHQQGGGDDAAADVGADRARGLGVDELVVEDEAVHRRAVLTVPLRRPGQRDPLALAELADELAAGGGDALLALRLGDRLGGQLGAEEGTDLVAEGPLVLRDGEVHLDSLISDGRGAPLPGDGPAGSPTRFFTRA